MANDYSDYRNPEVEAHLDRLEEKYGKEQRIVGPNPIWELWQGVEKSRPWESRDSVKMGFLREDHHTPFDIMRRNLVKERGI